MWRVIVIMVSIDVLREYKKIVVWGAGKKSSGGFWRGLIHIDYIVDSDKAKWGKELFGIKIKSPKTLLYEDVKGTAILICSVYEKEIREQIKSMGFQSDVYASAEIIPNIPGGGYCKVSYSQYGEDAIIQGLTKQYNIQIKHYMDIGANHPCYGNATLVFYLEGATGCLVEPNSDYIQILKNYRPNDTVIQCGVSSNENDGKELLYYEIERWNTRNTFSKEQADEYRKRDYLVNEKYVPMISLNRLIEKFGQKVDYISIDVEGLEYEILKDFDFGKYNILIWNIEKSDSAVNDILLKNNYTLVAETLSNEIYLKNGLK